MKQLILFFVLSITAFCAHGQKAPYTVDHHTWAGGMCCSGGTDYSITLLFRARHFTCFDSLRLETHGVVVTIGDNEFQQVRYGDSLILFSLRFGSSVYGPYTDGHKQTENHYGIEGDRLKWTGVAENRIVLLRGKEEEVLEDAVFTESMTAYP